MKALFLALLLANLLLFGWYYRQQPAGHGGGHNGVALHANVPRLKKLQSGTGPAYPEAAAPPGATAARGTGSGHHGSASPGSTAPTSAGAECLSVGPYASRSTAETDATRYQRAGLKVDRRRVSQQFRVGTWVYLGPFKSHRIAETKALRLRRKGIHDLYVVAAPQWRNAVSLGLYSKRASVARRVSELQRLGVKPKVRDRYRSTDRFWLTVHPAGKAGSLDGSATPSPTAPNAHAVRVSCREIAALSGGD
ncbi:MAG TPA: hypothetical protein VFA95_13640 [Gammaproteobacteria bacterium]|nr:hypothetical protein [Gammaproteobacteria bacterium]